MAAHRPLRSDSTQARGAGHIKQLDTLDGKEELYYLTTKAEAILFDTQALLSSLRAHTQFQVLHAYRARVNETNDPDEAKLFDIIINDSRDEVKGVATQQQP